jgi:hypothetical protein
MPVGSRLTAKVRGPAGMFGFRDRRLSVPVTWFPWFA